MNIVFLSHFAGSPRHGMVYGHYYLAREWVRMGHEVTIVAASYAHTRFQQPDSQVSEERIDGIRYLWLKVPGYKATGRIGRVLNIIAFTIASYSPFLRKKLGRMDLVISSSHHPFSIFPAQSIAKKNSAQLVFEVRDIWPLTLIELGGASPKHPFIRLMQWAENYAYRTADKVVSVLPGADKHMLEHGMTPNKFVYIPNGADLDNRQAEPLSFSHQSLIENLRDQNRFVIGYAGRMGLANALHHLIDALTLIDNPNIHAVLLGDGYELENLKKLALEKGISDRVHFLSSVPKAQVESFLRQMDVLYVGFLKQPIYRFGTSVTKMNDYMFAQKPVVCAIDGAIEGVEATGAGLMCKAENIEQIASAISEVFHYTSEMREQMGVAGHEWVRAHRDYKILAERFLEMVMSR